MYESYPDYLDLRDRYRGFDGPAGFTVGPVGLDTGENPSRAWIDAVTGVVHMRQPAPPGVSRANTALPTGGCSTNDRVDAAQKTCFII